MLKRGGTRLLTSRFQKAFLPPMPNRITLSYVEGNMPLITTLACRIIDPGRISPVRLGNGRSYVPSPPTPCKLVAS